MAKTASASASVISAASSAAANRDAASVEKTNGSVSVVKFDDKEEEEADKLEGMKLVKLKSFDYKECL